MTNDTIRLAPRVQMSMTMFDKSACAWVGKASLGRMWQSEVALLPIEWPLVYGRINPINGRRS